MKKLIILTGAILVFLGVLFVFFRGGGPTSKVIEDQVDINWEVISETCECIEHNNLYCLPKGFEIGRGDLCWKDNSYTLPVKGCSKYNCSGEVVEVE